MAGHGFDVAGERVTPELVVFGASRNSRAAGAGGGAPSASRDDDGLLNGILRNAAESVLSTVLQDQCDRCGETFTTFLVSFPLTVGAGNLRAVTHEPASILLDDRGELV